ncbi:phage baseplate assembly protein V [Actinoplanes sp. M2I2]|uniref:phage baseplate assembly protein V n=1 Tax=Actinoplanes sp. M2I2 TaxID=1734444 RepID=UPI0020219656|nr:phage baseplate assembly protein V [Actinoplanes sp. M2I2]
MTLPGEHSGVRPDGPLLPGLYPATVTALEGDPLGLQRVQVALDWLLLDDDSGPPLAWAVPVSPYADSGQGVQLLPEIGSTVVVGFLAGRADFPYLLGGVWNGKAGMPEKPTDANDLRIVQSRSGSRLEFDDTPGAAAVRLSAAGPPGQAVHSLVLDDAARTVTVHSASGATVTLTATGGVTIEAAATVEITAASVTVNAATSQFNGVVTCQTLIATGGGVVSPAYTPGAGNVW